MWFGTNSIELNECTVLEIKSSLLISIHISAIFKCFLFIKNFKENAVFRVTNNLAITENVLALHLYIFRILGNFSITQHQIELHFEIKRKKS